MFPQAELFTSVYDPAPWPAQITERAGPRLLPEPHPRRRAPLPEAAAADERRLSLASTSRASTWCSRAATPARRTCARRPARCTSATATRRCATPGRRASSRARRSGALTRLALPPLLARLRRQDLAGARRAGRVRGQLRHVAERIERYYGRSAEVVHPPVDVEHYLGLERDPSDYYLVFGRVVPYKRVDLAVAACARLGRRAEGRRRRTRAGGGAGAAPGAGRRVARQGLRRPSATRCSSGARALLFPGEEDFGIVPVEAQAAGAAGDRLRRRRRRRDGASTARTGVLFAEQSAARAGGGDRALRGARSCDEQAVRENADASARERFRAEMAAVIARAADARRASLAAASADEDPLRSRHGRERLHRRRRSAGVCCERGHQVTALVRRAGSEPRAPRRCAGDLGDAERLSGEALARCAARLRRAPRRRDRLAAQRREGARGQRRRHASGCSMPAWRSASGEARCAAVRVRLDGRDRRRPRRAARARSEPLPVETPYGRSKQEGERMVLESGLPAW